MGLKIIIAEPRDILRRGLFTILANDKRVETIREASSGEELQRLLRYNTIDLAIINQALISDMTTLPARRFVIFAAEFNITIFLMAYKHGARGYLLETSHAELFRATLSLPPEAFLIEPVLTSHIVEYLTQDTRFLVKEELLTPREKEIVRLLREGIDRHTIAHDLHISGATLKTHIKNISRKRIDVSL